MNSRLAPALAAARAAWPHIELEDRVFLAHVTAHAISLDDVRVEDLYLACACAKKSAAALQAFEEHYLRTLDAPLRRTGASPDLVGEIKQLLRHQLLLGDAPGIEQYRGQGDLRSWIRIIAVREAVRLLRDPERHVPIDEALAAATEEDPELRYLRGLYQAEFKQALKEAVDRRLSRRQRTLLRLQYLDGLTLEQIAAMYRVHRATAARWLAETKQALNRGTRAILQTRLGVAGTELESILRLLLPKLEITLRRILKN